jgi:signal transduction histidine kinase
MARRVARNVPVIVATSAGLVLLVAGTLTWLGWHVLSQEEDLIRQRSRDRLEQAADALLASFLRTVSDAESSLGQLGTTLPADGDGTVHHGPVLVMLSASGVQTRPAAVLPYHPVSPRSASIDYELFQPAERLELQANDLKGAAALLLPLTRHRSAAIRAEALMQLARVQRKSGDVADALDTYARLTDIALVGPAEVPYALVSRVARCELLVQSNAAAAQTEARSLLGELEAGRFPLGKENYVLYDTKLRAIAGGPPRNADTVSVALAETVEMVWQEWQIFQSRGMPATRRTRLHASRPVPMVAVLDANRDRMAALIYSGEALRHVGLDRTAGTDAQSVRVSLLDERGVPIIGGWHEASGTKATRSLSAAQLPWQLAVASSADDSAESLLAQRRNYFAVILGGILALVCVACYAMARGVLREAAAGRLQSDFVSAVSHEFRSPLTTLRQLTELLAHGRVQDEGRRRLYFDVLQKETSRLHQLVENLLDFGRMDAGRRQYRLEPVDFNALVREGVEEYSAESSSNRHRIELTSEQKPLLVEADREALCRVVRNLLENAVKYSPDSPTVWVETAHDSRAAVLRVRDEGIGIPLDEQSRVFDKFVRGEGAKRACIQGTGIGLAMVKEIVQVHRGDVEVSSEVGRGSTFEVRLPLTAMERA